MSTSRLAAPFRPLPLRAANALGRGLGRMGWGGLRLDEDRVLQLACRQTKLDDFGSDSFLPGLRKLLASLECDAQLNPFGRFFARRQLGELLGHRLRLVEHRKRHPEVAAQEIRRPLFVVGLPRTGTSLLYALLARDPAHRAPLSWEVDEPCPPPETATYANDPRIAHTEARMQQLRQLAPGFQEIHPVGSLMPQECIVLTASEFMSIRFEMCFDVASYQEWLVDQDMAPAYRWHRRFLQHLQSRCPGERWVLKSPGHLGPVDALLATYPDALIVQTHRDPLRVVPSVSSLEYCMRGVASDAVDPVAIGRQQLHLWSTLIDQGMRARAGRPDQAGQFLDLHFHEIVADPLGCVRRIYRHFDLELTSRAEARMHAFVAESPRAGHGVHDYSLARFGLDAEAVSQTFKSYRERFGVRPEPT
ncbi:MAG: sulfotransferase [Deltaproteobacteria bacterium]|nr:sulfotransferase [Deltaproteobacteria bacterium]MBW2362272.1 sulfotransferase [Deltaproteobacteria bacterium]